MNWDDKDYIKTSQTATEAMFRNPMQSAPTGVSYELKVGELNGKPCLYREPNYTIIAVYKGDGIHMFPKNFGCNILPIRGMQTVIEFLNKCEETK